MSFVLNPRTGALDFRLDDVTGARIVRLLEALENSGQLSHTSLSDILADDHHSHEELNAWLDDVVLEDGGAITTTQVATFAQLTLTPSAEALAAVEGGIFYNSADKSVYVCTEGA